MSCSKLADYFLRPSNASEKHQIKFRIDREGNEHRLIETSYLPYCYKKYDCDGQNALGTLEDIVTIQRLINKNYDFIDNILLILISKLWRVREVSENMEKPFDIIRIEEREKIFIIVDTIDGIPLNYPTVIFPKPVILNLDQDRTYSVKCEIGVCPSKKINDSTYFIFTFNPFDFTEDTVKLI